jgi:Mg2+-importing ATPase
MRSRPSAVLPKRSFPLHEAPPRTRAPHPRTVELADVPLDEALARLGTSLAGLRDAEARARLAQCGPNELERDKPMRVGARLLRALVKPLPPLLALLAAVSLATGDARSATVIALMLALSVGLQLVQEARADRDVPRAARPRAWAPRAISGTCSASRARA